MALDIDRYLTGSLNLTERPSLTEVRIDEPHGHLWTASSASSELILRTRIASSQMLKQTYTVETPVGRYIG